VSFFGSLSGWGVTADESDSHEQPAGEAVCGETQDALSGTMRPSVSCPTQESGEFDMLPDWADVEDDPDYNVLLVRDSDLWSVTSIALSGAALVQDALAMPRTARDDVEGKKRGHEGEGGESRSKRRKLKEDEVGT
jgi:hypothetical protein